MPTAYPTVLDTLATINPTDDEAVVSHSGRHTTEGGAIVALETKVGINNSAVTTSHDYKIRELEYMLDPRREASFYDDFLAKPPTAITPNTTVKTDWVAAGIGSGGSIASVGASAVAGRPGIWVLNCGTTATGITALHQGDATPIVLGGGVVEFEYSFRVTTNLSDAANRFSVSMGLRDTFAGASTNVLYVIYSDNINAGKPVLRSIVAGVTTDANASTTAVVVDTWMHVRVSVNAARTEAKLYINGTLEATLSATLASAVMRFGMNIVKSVGLVARNVQFDYMRYRERFTTQR